MTPKKHYINIADVLKFAKETIEKERELGNFSNVEHLRIALEEIEMAVHNPEMDRKRVVEEFLTVDPFCWSFIPNFADIEQECIDTDNWEVEVEFPYEEDAIVANLVC
jgi:hypothetical protein